MISIIKHEESSIENVVLGSIWTKKEPLFSSSSSTIPFHNLCLIHCRASRLKIEVLGCVYWTPKTDYYSNRIDLTSDHRKISYINREGVGTMNIHSNRMSIWNGMKNMNMSCKKKKKRTQSKELKKSEQKIHRHFSLNEMKMVSNFSHSLPLLFFGYFLVIVIFCSNNWTE